MFDYDPTDDPPYGKEDLANYYDYFEENPELGPLPQEVRECAS